MFCLRCLLRLRVACLLSYFTYTESGGEFFSVVSVVSIFVNELSRVCGCVKLGNRDVPIAVDNVLQQCVDTCGKFFFLLCVKFAIDPHYYL